MTGPCVVALRGSGFVWSMRSAIVGSLLVISSACQTQQSHFCHPGMVEEDGGGIYFRRDEDGGGMYHRPDGGGMYHRRDEQSDGRRQQTCRGGVAAPPPATA